ncbi:hypothetical protein AGABI2DRAFT_140272 [Agaricus bisporus var. bisporus H97]|uniref:hypothetical protein n=1 Tax=Agaricus bisporus var. bisporus (strain H97 / ATCC MYA-4626 / FGSC 10389) TaxID=936046 RepID=UPI00029F5585|nr:hypothetical protein AGABI2DRAFT_140272 [Agaricus bisporus var. bisporus H97]EKV51229.1 hypothetical protein AGABI2DRAFT_140272 [Agaricus bisporus var. bisporus H97]
MWPPPPWLLWEISGFLAEMAAPERLIAFSQETNATLIWTDFLVCSGFMAKQGGSLSLETWIEKATGSRPMSIRRKDLSSLIVCIFRGGHIRQSKPRSGEEPSTSRGRPGWLKNKKQVGTLLAIALFPLSALLRLQAGRGGSQPTRYLAIVDGDDLYRDASFATEAEIAQLLAVCANQWVVGLSMQWQSISAINNENFEAGAGIWRALASYPGELNPSWDAPGRRLAARVHEAVWGTIPPLEDVFAGFLADPSKCSVVFCGPSQCRADRIPPLVALATLMMGTTDFAGLCSILAIPVPETEERYQPAAPTWASPRTGECEIWVNPCTGAAWDFNVVPGGGLASPRVCTWIADAYISHFQGKNLWLLWPGTAGNYQKLYGPPFRGFEHRLGLAEAIEVLDGLEVLVVSGRRPTAWTIPAGTICASLSFSRLSGHGGFFYMPYAGWKRSRDALRAFEEVAGSKAWHGWARGQDYLHEALRLLPAWLKIASDRREKSEPDLEMEEWIVGTATAAEKKLTRLRESFCPLLGQGAGSGNYLFIQGRINSAGSSIQIVHGRHSAKRAQPRGAARPPARRGYNRGWQPLAAASLCNRTAARKRGAKDLVASGRPHVPGYPEGLDRAFGKQSGAGGRKQRARTALVGKRRKNSVGPLPGQKHAGAAAGCGPFRQ